MSPLTSQPPATSLPAKSLLATTSLFTTIAKKFRWLKEVVLLAVFYLVYTYIRNRFGSSTTAAFENASQLIGLEENIGLYVEADIQSWFLDNRYFIRFWNYFYGTAHFVITLFTFIWVYSRFPKHFPRIRNIGLWSTGLGLIIFATYPVMPPRLLNSTGKFGAANPDNNLIDGASFFHNFTDTIKEFGGFFVESGTSPIESISNQYAAMPSIHIVWALWCAFAIYPLVKNPVLKGLAALYPLSTLFAIIVTANHYWIDAIGGVILFGFTYLLFEKWLPRFAKTPLGSKIITPISQAKALFKACFLNQERKEFGRN